MCEHSTVPAATASAACGIGTISPAAATVIWNLPPVASEIRLAASSAEPKIVSRAFGKPDEQRQRTVGCALTMAGAARLVPAPAPTAACFRKERRAMEVSLWGVAAGWGRPVSERREVRAVLSTCVHDKNVTKPP